VTDKFRYSGMLLAIALAACTMPATGGSKTADGCTAGASLGQSPAGLAQTTLCIASGAKARAFTVEIARTSAEQAKGMMFRTEMADDTGMIFPFTEPRPASFWMKNTVIPLDIIFIRSNGTIESIAENTVPYSTDPVESGEPVAAVLELRGGLTSELGIASGDTVRWTGK
jgi:uncharacterized membrane protein (UPF0127 family)